MVTTTFHTIAEIYRTSEQQSAESIFTRKGPMLEQLICLLSSFLAAPTAATNQ